MAAFRDVLSVELKLFMVYRDFLDLRASEVGDSALLATVSDGSVCRLG